MGYDISGFLRAGRIWVAWVLTFTVSSFARAQSTASPDLDWRKLLTPEVWAVLFTALSGWLTMPLTTALKQLFKTEGLTTVAVNSVLNALLLGLIPWLVGVYPFAYALVAALVGILLDKASHTSIKDIADSSQK